MIGTQSRLHTRQNPILLHRYKKFSLKQLTNLFEVTWKNTRDNVHRKRGINRYRIVIAGGHGWNAPMAISSQSRPSKRDSNMTISECKTSSARETTVFSLCARWAWHFNRAVPLAPKVISVQITYGCICALSLSCVDSANQIMS